MLAEVVSEGENNPQVTRVGNDIYFYCNVDVDTCLELIKLLKEVDSWPQWDVAKSALKPITIHIHSPGGLMLPALGVIDIIKTLDSRVISVVEGYAASAATLISMACDERQITKNSFLLVHQLSTWFVGTFEEFKDYDKLEQMLMNRMRQFYVDSSKVSMKKITKMLQHDYWMDSSEALKKGFVDKIV